MLERIQRKTPSRSQLLLSMAGQLLLAGMLTLGMGQVPDRFAHAWELGLKPGARRKLEEAGRLQARARRRLAGAPARSAAEVGSWLGTWREPGALELLRRARELARQAGLQGWQARGALEADLGRALTQLGQLGRAEEVFRRGLRLSAEGPDLVSATRMRLHAGLGNVLALAARPAEALPEVELAARLALRDKDDARAAEWGARARALRSWLGRAEGESAAD